MLLDGHKNFIMKANLFFLLILLFSFPEQTPAKQDACPPWFIPDNTSVTGCSCHQDDKYDIKVYCGPDFPLLRFGFCMTNNKTGVTEFGPCPYIACYNTTTYFDGSSTTFRYQVMCSHLMSSCVVH